MDQRPSSFWSISSDELLQQIQSTQQGLTDDEAKRRINLFGYNRLKPKKRTGSLILLLSQFKNPIIIILIFAAILSPLLLDPTDAIIILVIVFISGIQCI